MRIAGAFFLLLVGLASLAACSDSNRGNLSVPPVDLFGNKDRLLSGRQLFAAHCAECHGSIAEGRTQRAARFIPSAPDFHERRYRSALPGYLYLRIELGRNMEPFQSAGSVMPTWKPYLKKEQIWDLVAYIRYRSGNVAEL